MATYLDLVNGVQRRLRVEVTPSVTSNDYSSLIGEFVNQAKREVEDAWHWSALRDSLTTISLPGESKIEIVGFNERARITDVRIVSASKREIKPATHDFIQEQIDLVTVADTIPEYWRLSSLDSPSDPDNIVLEFYPTPDALYSIRVHGFVPQSDLSADSDILTVPTYPVLLGAYLLALAERGDDAGMSERRAQAEYQSALSDAIAIDSGNHAAGFADDWKVA